MNKFLLTIIVLIIVSFTFTPQAAEKVVINYVKVKVKALNALNHLPIEDAKVCVVYYYPNGSHYGKSCELTNEKGEAILNMEDGLLDSTYKDWELTAEAGGFNYSVSPRRKDSPIKIKNIVKIYLTPSSS